jgi:nucleotide-binding universal stress UspA family protein
VKEETPMNTIRSILVHLDGTERAAVRLRIAHELAVIHKATLTALFAVAPRFVPLQLGGGAQTVPLRDEIDPEHRARAKSLFERTVSHGAAASSWHELTDEFPIPGFVERAFLSDLMVLGQRHPTDPTGFDVPAGFVEAAIVDSGRPALVVPHAGDATADAQTVLVAWKSSREAAHAVTAALPFLRRAKHVHVVCHAENAVDTHLALKQIGQYLGQHGVAALPHHGVSGSDIGRGLLRLAEGVGADLLVMGCYGHSRARELMLGGASRTVLESMPLPVLLAH